MTAATDGTGRIDVAARRMERALSLLEQRLEQRLAQAGAQAGDLVAQDRARLATDLDHARGRQRDLEEAGAQASRALERAIAQIRATLATMGFLTVAQLAIEVNGKPYIVGCEDGHEERLRELAALIDAQVRQVSRDVGQLGDTRLILMGALMIADELSDAKARMASAEEDALQARARLDRAEAEVAATLDAAAQRIEAIAAE